MVSKSKSTDRPETDEPTSDRRSLGTSVARAQTITSAIRGAVPNSVLAVPMSRKPTAR